MDYTKYYKVGDTVTLPASSPPGWATGSMDKYLGKQVVITYISDDERFRFDGSETWCFLLNEIPLTEEIKERIEKDTVEEDKRMRKQLKKLVIHPEQLYSIAAKIFGEEYVDIQDNTMDKTPLQVASYKIILHFPEIIVKNHNDLSHVVRDIFMSIEVSNIQLLEIYKANIDLQGTRTTFTVEEYHSRYVHSHLQTCATERWGQWCLGNHSDFRNIRDRLRLSLLEEDWWLFFLSIRNYLEWESLEGGPYVKIENIKGPSSISRDEYKIEAGKIVKYLPPEVWSVGKHINLIPTHPSVYSIFNKFSSIRNSSFINKKVYESKQDYFQKQINKRPTFIFKGRVIPYIIDIKEDIETVEVPPIDRSIIDTYCILINSHSINYKKIHEYERRKQTSSVFADI